MVEQVKEMVRFTFQGKLVRITRETGFEYLVERASGPEWTTINGDATVIFGTDPKVAVVLDTLVLVGATFDGIEEDMGKQLFMAAMTIPTMHALGFGSVTFN